MYIFTDPPPLYSVDDCPPGYYDIYPHKSIRLSSLAKNSPSDNDPTPLPPPPPPTTTTTTAATTATTTATNNNNTVTSSVSNGDAEPSASQSQRHNIDEVSSW